MNPYRVLGVDPNAPDEVIAAAYRALAKKHHPDSNRHDPNADARMTEINEAYAILSNPTNRRAYDAMQARTSTTTPRPAQRPAGSASGPGNTGTATPPPWYQQAQSQRTPPGYSTPTTPWPASSQSQRFDPPGDFIEWNMPNPPRQHVRSRKRRIPGLSIGGIILIIVVIRAIVRAVDDNPYNVQFATAPCSGWDRTIDEWNKVQTRHEQTEVAIARIQVDPDVQLRLHAANLERYADSLAEITPAPAMATVIALEIQYSRNTADYSRDVANNTASSTGAASRATALARSDKNISTRVAVANATCSPN